MKRVVAIILSVILLLFVVLLIPAEPDYQPELAGSKQFLWNRDSLWNSLESLYVKNKTLSGSQLEESVKQSLGELEKDVLLIEKNPKLPGDGIFHRIENKLFSTAALIGASQNYIPVFTNLFSRIRNAVKKQSENWNMSDLTARQTLYKLIYGGRAAVEELILQADRNKISPLIFGKTEISITPSIELKGVRVHSGDILISRGGAPTSALIARGNDYPGNFSHVALLYIDEKNNHPYIIESHIEKGVAVSSIEEYLNDKKLRIMILRLRADHPVMINDMMLPHRAAKLSYERAIASHIPYDFTMDFQDSTKLFCSEVASWAYKKTGVNLWMGLSNISSPGVAVWLAGFGVRHFVTQEPSDLEYDPQLSVVAEWRDPETLFQDHIDNAIVEAMLERAEEGKKLEHNWYLLPIARIMKDYSSLLNLFGKVGPVPEGMSPESALRHKKLVELHEKIKFSVDVKIKYFLEEMKYTPPYWKLVGFARESIEMNKLL
ncbi:MAG: hypothetical protein CVV24_08890 [Ignavibacteriae bacterium HGW-Ignavibacteriae-3]|nr:MAG: hypothetical protein CVV24_08890 [Ignavibacteriae bacterium HGW-Ignavibacteriae-3]